MPANYDNLLFELGRLNSEVSKDNDAANVSVRLKECQRILNELTNSNPLSSQQIETVFLFLQKPARAGLNPLQSCSRYMQAEQSKLAITLFTDLLTLAIDKAVEMNKIVGFLNQVTTDHWSYGMLVAWYQPLAEVRQYINMLDKLLDKGVPVEHVLQHLEMVSRYQNTNMGVIIGSNKVDALADLMQLVLKLDTKGVDKARLIQFLQAETKDNRCKLKTTLAYLLNNINKYQDVLVELYNRQLLPQTAIVTSMQNSNFSSKVIAGNKNDTARAYQLMLELVKRLQSESKESNAATAISKTLKEITTLVDEQKKNLTDDQVRTLLDEATKPVTAYNSSALMKAATLGHTAAEPAVQLFVDLTGLAMDRHISVIEYVNKYDVSNWTFGKSVSYHTPPNATAINHYLAHLVTLIDKGYPAAEMLHHLQFKNNIGSTLVTDTSEMQPDAIDNLVQLLCKLAQHGVAKTTLSDQLHVSKFGYSSIADRLCGNPVKYKSSIKMLIEQGMLPFEGFKPSKNMKEMFAAEIKAMTDPQAKLLALEDACGVGVQKQDHPIYKMLSTKRRFGGEINETKGTLGELNKLLKEARAELGNHKEVQAAVLPPVSVLPQQDMTALFPDVDSIVRSLQASDSAIPGFLAEDGGGELRNYLYEMAQFAPRILYLMFDKGLVREEDFAALTEVGMQGVLFGFIQDEADTRQKTIMLLKCIKPGEQLRAFMEKADGMLEKVRAEAGAVVQPARSAASLYPMLVPPDVRPPSGEPPAYPGGLGRS